MLYAFFTFNTVSKNVNFDIKHVYTELTNPIRNIEKLVNYLLQKKWNKIQIVCLFLSLLFLHDLAHLQHLFISSTF